MATEQEKFLQQREAEIAKLKADMSNFNNLHDEVAQLRAKHDEKDMALKSNEQSNQFPQKPF